MDKDHIAIITQEASRRIHQIILSPLKRLKPNRKYKKIKLDDKIGKISNKSQPQNFPHKVA